MYKADLQKRPDTTMRTAIVSLLILMTFTTALPAIAQEPVEITLWHQMLYAERVVLAEVLEDFAEQHPDITVTVIYRETEELRSGYQNSALAGTGPELVFGPSDQIGPFATMGIVRPMEEFFTEEELAALNPQGLTWYDDHLYQVADRLGNHLTLVYNRAYVPEAPQTFSELIEIGQANTVDLDNDGRTDRYGLVWNNTEPYFFVPFLGGFGGWVMDDEYNPTLNTEANRRAIQFVIDLNEVYGITPINTDYETANSLFLEGMAAMIINGDWSWSSYLDDGIDIGVTRIPLIDETGLWPTPMVSPKGFSMNVNIPDEKLEPTLTLLKFLLEPEQQYRLAAGTNMMPTALSLMDDPLITDNEIMRNSAAQIEVGRAMPVAPELRAIWDAMRPSYQAFLGGDMTAEEAAATMQAEAERKIREMNEVVPPSQFVWVLYVMVVIGVLFFIYKTRHSAIEFFHDIRKRPFVYWMVVPAFIVILLTVVYPFFYNIVLSLSNMSLRNFYSWDIIGLQNYGRVFVDPNFYSVLLKTIIWTGVNIVFHVTIGVFLAILLHRVLPGKGAIRTILILPWAVPQYITALTWRGMFNQEYGAINLIISKYMSMPIVNWLGSPEETFLACILTNVWLGFPFMMVVALGGLQSIPWQLYEAADIDGGGWWTKLTRITLPLLKPVMTPAIVLGIVWTFNNLNVIWLVSNGGEPSDQTHILVSFVYKSAFNLYRYGYAAALSMVIFAILLTFSVIFMKRNKATEAVY